MILAYMMSLTSTTQSKVVPVLCLLQKRASSESRHAKLTAEQVHTLWPVKFCPKTGANLFSLMCELLQGNKISSDHQNNIIVNTPTSDIILDCQIKTRNSCCRSRLSMQSQWWEGSICCSPTQEKYQQPSHWVRSFIWDHYPCHCHGPWYQSNQEFELASWKLVV